MKKISLIVLLTIFVNILSASAHNTTTTSTLSKSDTTKAKSDTSKTSATNTGAVIPNYSPTGTYIIAWNILVQECDPVGAVTGTSMAIAKQGYIFHVKGNNLNGDAIVQFKNFKPKSADPAVVKAFNGKYFLISKNSMDKNVRDLFDVNTIQFTYGVLVIPFKFRPTKSLFTSNLNLGSSVYAQFPGYGNWSYGAVLGLSLSSVTLDSLSTSGKVKTNTDRPAFTPSFSFVASHGALSLILGIGADFINGTSDVEKSWVFNRKPWIGFGIGINLFSSGNNNTSQVASSDDKQ